MDLSLPRNARRRPALSAPRFYLFSAFLSAFSSAPGKNRPTCAAIRRYDSSGRAYALFTKSYPHLVSGVVKDGRCQP